MWLSNQQSRIIRRRSTVTLPTIAGLALWLKADAITGLSDADAITTWTDFSGNGRNAAQADAGLKPVYKTGIIGGKPVARFAADYLTIASSVATFKFLHNAQATVFVVASFGAVANPDAAYGIAGNNAGSGSNIGFCAFFDDRASVPRNNAVAWRTTNAVGGASDVILAASDDVLTPQVFAIIANTSNTTAAAAARNYMRINGGGALATNAAANAGSASNATYDLQIGALGNNALPLTGDIAEIIVYDSALSDANRQAVEAYLSAKYAIALA